MTKILVTYDMFREGFTELESKYLLELGIVVRLK